MTIKDAKDIIKNQLLKDIALLPKAERVTVEYPKSIENYQLTAPTAAYLIVYKGGKYSESKTPNIVLQDKDMEISVVIVSKNLAGKTCEEHIDFIADSVAGIEIDGMRPDGKIIPVSDEWIDETDGVWKYAITFKVPVDFIEKEARAKLTN